VANYKLCLSNNMFANRGSIVKVDEIGNDVNTSHAAWSPCCGSVNKADYLGDEQRI